MVRDGKCVRSGSVVEHSLRRFVAGLRDASKGTVAAPPGLAALARHVLASVPAERYMDPEDLVSELVERLLDARRRHGARVVEELLAVDSVQRVLRERLRRIASEHVPGRSLRKELRVHVLQALASPRPVRAVRRPEAILVDGRYRSAEVRAAVHWALAMGTPPEERALVSCLLHEFALGVTQVDAGHADARADEGAVPADSAVLARDLCARLGAEGARLVGSRLAGATLQELCARTGRKLTAVHTQVGRLEAELIDFVRASGAGMSQARGALRMLATAAAA